MDKISENIKFFYELLGAEAIKLFLAAGILFYLASFIYGLRDAPHQLLRINFANVFFYSGILILFFALFNVFSGWSVYQVKKYWYKYKYPIKNNDITFYLVGFKEGDVFLFDKLKKEIRWIENYITAIDLGLIGYWTILDKKMSNIVNSNSSIVKTKKGESFNLKDYKWGKGIRTQGLPARD